MNKNTYKLGFAATLFAAASMVSAAEPGDGEALRSDMLATPCLASTGALDDVRDLAREEAAAAAAAESAAEHPQIALDAEPAPGVIREVIELDGLPLVRLSDDDADKKIYFGISLDGVVGLHGKLR